MERVREIVVQGLFILVVSAVALIFAVIAIIPALFIIPFSWLRNRSKPATAPPAGGARPAPAASGAPQPPQS